MTSKAGNHHGGMVQKTKDADIQLEIYCKQLKPRGARHAAHSNHDTVHETRVSEATMRASLAEDWISWSFALKHKCQEAKAHEKRVHLVK